MSNFEPAPNFVYDPEKPGAGWHKIEEDLAETWIEDWAAAGIAEIEVLHAKHAEFARYEADPENYIPRENG
jgi:hypothetical protein